MPPLTPRAQAPRVLMTAHVRTQTTDIRKRMDDVYNEMEQASRSGRLRLPLTFLHFHETDVMYQFTRAAVGYAVAYVRVQTLEHEHAARASADELAKFQASQLQHQYYRPPEQPEHETASSMPPEQQATRLREAMDAHGACATLLAETYARLVLHCSNFEHHKEDERFFECVYYFVCAVVKVGLAPEHWIVIENELGFLFRGAQFSSTITRHSQAKTQREQAAAAAAAAAAASEAASGANTAAKKIQNLSANGTSTKETGAVRRDGSLFVLPTVPSTRCCFFPASLPVGKIVSELDAAKVRASRNMEISQSIRDRIRATRDDDVQRRQLEALVSPRVSLRLDGLRGQQRETEAKGALVPPLLPPHRPPRRRPQGNSNGSGSPRLSMKATFTSLSPAVNHLLPGTEDRVRLALEDYERTFQQTLEVQKRKRRAKVLDGSATTSDLSTSASTVSTVSTPTRPPVR